MRGAVSCFPVPGLTARIERFEKFRLPCKYRHQIIVVEVD